MPQLHLASRLYAPEPSAVRAPANDNLSSGPRCPCCGGAVDVRFDGGEYSGCGVVHQHWHCDACAHDWITVLLVPA